MIATGGPAFDRSSRMADALVARGAGSPASSAPPGRCRRSGWRWRRCKPAAAAAQVGDSMRGVVALILMQGAFWLAAVGLLMRGARSASAGCSAWPSILRLTILFLPPYLSDDIYRYIWDGRVQGAGVNPYLYIPNDPALAGLRDAERSGRTSTAPIMRRPSIPRSRRCCSFSSRAWPRALSA